MLAFTKYITYIIHQVGRGPSGQGRPEVGLPPSQQAGGVLREPGHRAVPATPPQAQARQHAASNRRRRRRTQRGRQMVVNFHGGGWVAPQAR
jgi:hypothetical protein